MGLYDRKVLINFCEDDLIRIEKLARIYARRTKSDVIREAIRQEAMKYNIK